MADGRWDLRCSWKNAGSNKRLEHTTQTSHVDEQQARDAARDVFSAYRDLTPLTIDTIEIKAPGGAWEPILPYLR